MSVLIIGDNVIKEKFKMKYGLPEEEIQKLCDEGKLIQDNKRLCLACYQEGKDLEDCYFECIKYPHLHHKHPKLKGDYKTVYEAYMAVYHVTKKNKDDLMGNPPRNSKNKIFKELSDQEIWRTIQKEGIGNWSQRKLITTALKLEKIANLYIEMAKNYMKDKDNEGFMDCMDRARQCMDTVGKLIKPTTPPRAKIPDEDAGTKKISKKDKKQMDILAEMAERIKKDSKIDMSKIDGAWDEPNAEPA